MDGIEIMRAFAAVAATGSFTRAAERLGTTPQLVSKYVKALEDDLGARLLNRTTRSVALTETGRAFEPRCARLIEDYDALRSEARAEHAALRGRLAVTAPATFGELHLAPAIGGFLDAFPEMTLDLTLTDRFVTLVDEGFDMAVRIGALEDSSLIARRLCPARLALCASPGYLDHAGLPERPADLARHACVIDANIRAGERWPFVVDGRRETVAVSGRVRVNGATAARALALAGAGIALCPTYVVGPDLRAGRLVPVLEGCLDADLAVFAVYPESRHLSAKIRAFVDFLAERLSGAPWDDPSQPRSAD